MIDLIDRKRVGSFLEQQIRRTAAGHSWAEVDHILDVVQSIVEECGEATRNRRMINRIALALLEGPCPMVVAPACPDYSHENGQYSFRSLGGGVSLLALQQIRFLAQLSLALPGLQGEILIADQEAEDEVIRRACGVDRDEAVALIQRSIRATRAFVAGRGWGVTSFTTAIPDLAERQREMVARLLADTTAKQRLDQETLERRDLYHRISRALTWEEMRARTARTAAQYIILGQYAAENNWLLSNHTTANLQWFGQTGAALLHNPVAVY